VAFLFWGIFLVEYDYLKFIAENDVSIGWGTHIVQLLIKVGKTTTSYVAYHKVTERGGPINTESGTVSPVYWKSKEKALKVVLEMAIAQHNYGDKK
jgi:hypothetical protein